MTPDSAELKLGTTEIRIRGKDTYVPSVVIDGCTVIASGRTLRVARLFDEELVVRRNIPEPGSFIPQLKASPLRADIFSFSQRPPDVSPRFPYPIQWSNWAIVNTTPSKSWWEALPQEARKNARLAEKRGVVTKCVTFDDELVHGIKRIYDETPVRQGRAFWHYGKSFEAVKKENSTYLDRSTFVGAYVEGKLIGFIKFIAVDEVATLIQILATAEHRDKKPMNALLKATIELCEQMGLTRLTYGKYNYGVNDDSSLAEFKRRNGFSQVDFPTYVVPLTLKGKIAISSGLHLGWRNAIPPSLRAFLVKSRASLLRRRNA